MRIGMRSAARRVVRGPLIVAAGLSVALSAAPAPTFAQTAAPETRAAPIVGVLVLNQERLLTESVYGQRIQSELEEASSRLAAENRAIEAELTADELALTEQRPTLEADAFRVLADRFDERVEGIRAAQEAKARDLGVQADRARQQFYDRAAPILLDIVRARGAAVLMDSRSVLLSAELVDITDAAIAAVNERLGNGGDAPLISLELGPREETESTQP